MSKKLKILLVANSVPLPATDFLKYKLFGLSKLFNLHFICWDSKANRDAFYQTSSDKLEGRNIHLFYDKLNALTIIRLSLLCLLRVLFTPHIAVPLFAKLSKHYNGKQLFSKFILYYPIVNLKPDIIHFEYGTLAHSFSDIKDYLQTKTTVSFRGYDINYVGLESGSYYDEVWSHFDGFHFLGIDLKNRAIKRGYISEKYEAVISPAIDIDFFIPADVEKNNKKFVVLSVGRFAWKKGYEYGLQAVAKLKEMGISTEYRIVAEGEHIQPIRFIISELGLEHDVVLLTGKTQNDIKTEMQKAHVLLHPALSEGFSNAVLEAQAMQLPVVATNADGLSENIEDGKTGFIVSVFDVQAMADKLEWCYDNQDKLIEMGQAGRKRVTTHFKIEDQIKKFEAFYKEVHAGG
ncbi:MAG: glycosyltransferase family 4 protein [Chitinophagales bacterium]|nr:glycosyltransferase family 4 protein [Chitinophagaceae bacterium]MCB9065391.1 glycosyltransferase family 4 protein [Chitinophagales bacterium]